jgi:hypothetical protein
MFVIMKRAVMKKVIFNFLDTKFPNAYIKKTIFGNLTMYGDDYVSTYGLTVELCYWFDVSQEFARHNIKLWESALPVVVNLRNSTNPDVWVADAVVYNTTTL